MMVDASSWVRHLDARRGFFTGVPCSLLSPFCAAVQDLVDPARHVVAANEGGAVSLAAGAYLATGLCPVVYLQNSGIGNAFNPLVSLAHPDVCGIPQLLIIGWRGEPGRRDEPQHETQGKITPEILRSLGMRHEVLRLDTDGAIAQTEDLLRVAEETRGPVALLVRRDTLSPLLIADRARAAFEMSREDAVRQLARTAPPGAVIVVTTGMASRELWAYRHESGTADEGDFLVVGSMGHASHIATGIALAKPQRLVLCVDGDGALLMHLGAMAIAGTRRPQNLCHVVLNNGAHDSVGGQPTVALELDLPRLALACRYARGTVVTTREELGAAVRTAWDTGPTFIEVRIRTGARPDLPRPTVHPRERARAFSTWLREGQ